MKKRVLFPLTLMLLVLGGAHKANSQTIDIGPNQYAFQFTGNNNFGLFFNSTDSRYEFRNGSAAPIFGFSALNGQMSTNLQFGSDVDYLVGPNRYAFRSSVAPSVGMFATNTRIQFLNATAQPIFSINIADGKFDTDLAFLAGKSVRVAPGQFGLRSAALPNAGLLFGQNGFEFRTASGSTGMYMDATTGDVGIGTSTPFSKFHVGGDLRLDGILLAQNVLLMQGWDVFADANQYVVNESNVGSRIQILPGGNVGLSTDAPTARLDVNGDARVRDLPLNNALSQVVVVDADGNLRKRDAATLGSGGGSPWLQNGTVAYYNNGRVGIGTNDPGASLGIHSSSAGNLLHLNNTAGGTAYQDFYSGATGHLTVGLVGGGNGEQVGQAIFWNRKNARLQFGTNDLPRMTIRNNGNVGIGTATPDFNLDVNGSTRSTNITTGSTQINVASNNRIQHIESCLPAGGSFLYADFWGCPNEFNFIEFRRGNTGMRFRVTQSGNVWANGKITAREVEVTLAAFPDYVFRPGYDLMSLSEVDQYIQANGHLPNMPTEAEVLENGLNLGDINVKLVEKVEELTLHLIEKDKEVKAMEERLKALEMMLTNPGK